MRGRSLLVVMALILPLLAYPEVNTNYLVTFMTFYEFVRAVILYFVFGYTVTYLSVVYWIRIAVAAFLAALIVTFFLKPDN